MKEAEAVKLNLGCGCNKIEGFINIDKMKSDAVDLILDISCNSLPFQSSSVDAIVCFHTLEHIEKRHHFFIFKEIHRVLKRNSTFLLSFPEFSAVAKNWLCNYLGKRSFWEATIYGRQLHEGDYHVCAMDKVEVRRQLQECGFYDVCISMEPKPENYNTVIKCFKNEKHETYEEQLGKARASYLIAF
jgi:predicted SAM-dependent methyltransferase